VPSLQGLASVVARMDSASLLAAPEPPADAPESAAAASATAAASSATVLPFERRVS